MTTQEPLLKAAMVGLRIYAGSLHPDKNHGLLKLFSRCRKMSRLWCTVNGIHISWRM